MAAGMLRDSDKFEQFSGAFDEEVRRYLNLDDLQGITHSDGELHANHIGLPLARVIRRSDLWGQGTYL